MHLSLVLRRAALSDLLTLANDYCMQHSCRPAAEVYCVQCFCSPAVAEKHARFRLLPKNSAILLASPTRIVFSHRIERRLTAELAMDPLVMRLAVSRRDGVIR